jgi:hypothetical protein
MVAFNYRQLIRLVPPRTWQFYFQSRQINLAENNDWDMPIDKLIPAIIASTDALPTEAGKIILNELRRVYKLANRRGVDALRNVAKPTAALHEDFPQLTSDAERALWVMANWPDLFDAAEAIYTVNQRVGKRGWKRLQVSPGENLFRNPEDIRALETALAEAFTPRKGTPRACQIDSLDRHLDGGLQLGILIEDDAQRRLEFGDDNRAFWRDVRPPLGMDVVIYPDSGVIDILAPGGAKTQQKVLAQLGEHIFKKPLQPQMVKKPMFFLNRLRDGFELFDDNQVDLAAHRVERIRLSLARVRANFAPHCDYTIKPAADKDAPDALACVKAHHIDRSLMGHGFNVVEAVVTVYFLPTGIGKAGRVLHIELKQSGISNLRDVDEADTQLVESLLQAWGVMQPSPTESTPDVLAPATSEALQ